MPYLSGQYHVNDSAKLWKNGIVSYIFDDNLSSGLNENSLEKQLTERILNFFLWKKWWEILQEKISTLVSVLLFLICFIQLTSLNNKYLSTQINVKDEWSCRWSIVQYSHFGVDQNNRLLDYAFLRFSKEECQLVEIFHLPLTVLLLMDFIIILEVVIISFKLQRLGSQLFILVGYCGIGGKLSSSRTWMQQFKF